jgi:hypothetical protein
MDTNKHELSMEAKFAFAVMAGADYTTEIVSDERTGVMVMKMTTVQDCDVQWDGQHRITVVIGGGKRARLTLDGLF